MSGKLSSRVTDPWRIWIDTGGTFTDCLALPPGATDVSDLRRAKVLSSGALRGRIISQRSANRFVIQQTWNVAIDDVVSGFDFVPLQGPSVVNRVKGFDAHASVLELQHSSSGSQLLGAVFELRSGEPAPILAARLVTQTPASRRLPPTQMRLATTRGTNALLERRGAPTVLFITAGFGDLLVIGDQQRPDLFALHISRPQPLPAFTVEVTERIAVDGTILQPLDLDKVMTRAKQLLSEKITSAAVALLHSHVNPAHEQQVCQALRKIGYRHVSCSSDLSPLIRILPRAQTAAVNAYLSPVVDGYFDEVRANLNTSRTGEQNPAVARSTLHVMTSAGGLTTAEMYRACDSLLSGPAGGVAGAAAAARQSGFSKIIGFDMGGTSTDAARYDGDFEYRFEHVVAGVRLMTPALAIETVAAGGGSICDVVDGDRMIVGPHSAGATPGPACYGAGGPLTLTDVNLLLGRLHDAVFEIPIDRAAAERAAQRIIAMIEQSSNSHAAAGKRDRILHGFLEIANERMAAAIESISIRQGYDPRDYALLAFGGAGGQHACAVADRLGMKTIIMPADASLLSAFGLGQSPLERFAQMQVLRTVSECAGELLDLINGLASQAAAELREEDIDPGRIQVRRIILNLRLLGQDSTLPIDLEPGALVSPVVQEAFAARYRAMYGHDIPPSHVRPIEVESIRVVVSTPVHAPVTAIDAADHRADDSQDQHTNPAQPYFEASSARHIEAYFNDRWQRVPAYDRAGLKAGASINGPAIVLDQRSTCIIEPNWSGVLDAAGALVLRRAADYRAPAAHRPEIIQQELFTSRFASIADEMGQILQRTALSTNVKERLDFSCALLNSEGELVVNAPHIPVHLGALGMCVRAVRQAIHMAEGDVIITNHPAFGGSHLPDVTVITPVFHEGTLIGYVANRAHHAEIGGSRPGSMPPDATRLQEEGVIIPPQRLVHAGQSRFEAIERLLRSGPYPTRALRDNMADLRAAVAANQRGVAALLHLAKQFGSPAVASHMQAIADRAERLTRSALAQIKDGRYRAVQRHDDGSPICAAIDIRGDAAMIDFTGSAGVHAGNLNATPAIVRSAVMYVLRLLIGERLPLNEGIMRAVEVRIPDGMLNPPFAPDAPDYPAVVGGNTETSQRIVNTLLEALGICACSQGTMNNVLFGNERFGYYETVCGGTGAGPGFNGADAVHSHMTNTRITDPEIIEHRYPVRINRFAIRRGSGGEGRWRGGDGATREYQFLQPMALSILSQNRTQGPCGLRGGSPGAPGDQRIIRAGGGGVTSLNSIDGCYVLPGDRLILNTPGGGGCG